MNNLTVGGSLDGKPFVYYETIAGGHGASPDGSGLSGCHSHMTNTLNTPIESLEYTLPLRVLEYTLREGSGGAGLHMGGEGIRRTYEFLTPATVTINSERRITSPYGLNGGGSGAPGVNTYQQGEQARTVGGKYTLRVHVGDRLRIETPGGGGWGIPDSTERSVR
jgi:N-methylhydantoinase B